MNETCEHETFAKVKAYREIYGCPFCRIDELELARDNYKNVLVGMEFENIDSLATESRDTTQIGRVAAQRLQQHIYRIAELEDSLSVKDDINKILRPVNDALGAKIVELEKQLAEQGICEICKDKSVLVADKYSEQNAKLVEALEKIASQPLEPAHIYEIADRIKLIAAVTLKEMEVGDDLRQ